MQYAILIYETAQEMSKRNDPKLAEAYWGAWTAYAQAIAESGIMRGGEGLGHPSTATQVSLKDGKRHVQDGPFADTKEQLGGFFIIEVENLDQALAWAARCPAMGNGHVEIRPTLPPPAL